MRSRFALVLAAALPLALHGFAQSSGSGAAIAPATGSSTFSVSVMVPPNIPGIVGAPYSAEGSGQSVQTLVDGTHITRTVPGQKVWRDSQGRTRTERALSPPYPNRPAPPVAVEIVDPVAGVYYILDIQNKVAHRAALRQLPARPAAQAQVRPQSPPAYRPETKSESLGTQTVEGLPAIGSRTTVTTPVDAIGNDRPIVSATESWTSTELRIILLTRSNSPQSGESVWRLTNISRVEPEPGLFRPPLDYQVVDEAGASITLQYAPGQ